MANLTRHHRIGITSRRFMNILDICHLFLDWGWGSRPPNPVLAGGSKQSGCTSRFVELGAHCVGHGMHFKYLRCQSMFRKYETKPFCQVFVADLSIFTPFSRLPKSYHIFFCVLYFSHIYHSFHGVTQSACWGTLQRPHLCCCRRSSLPHGVMSHRLNEGMPNLFSMYHQN